ncbi:MAG TPA: two-component system VirA-like sensor kinase [Acetobacteraceae bacterium]|nr:two-component system VirA-like sensor kinase [Acetobacteraceae bacterium]
MKVAPAIAAVPLLIVLLTWLSVRAINPDAERYDQALAEMERFELLEAELHRDVLSVRAGALRNYDPLVREADALDESVGRLRQTASFDSVTTSLIDRLRTMVMHQEALVEQLKSDNALLQNSLAYIAQFSGEESGPLAPLVSSLAASMLRFTLDTSPTAASEVQDRLDRLTNRSFQGETSSIEALLAHGRLLHDLLPTTDDVLKAILSVPQASGQTVLRATILGRQSASRQAARQFRMSLYVVSLLLVGLLVHVGLQLHARSRALRRKALFEHVLAAVSMSFVTARERDLDAALENALAEMALCLGAERAYVVLSGGPSARTYTWNSHRVTFAPGWPDQAFAVMNQVGSTVDGIVHVANVLRMPSGINKKALTDAGLRGWACVSRDAMDDVRVLLGFDTVTHPSRILRTGELSLLPMAIDAITNALSRQVSEQERARLELRLQQARRLETVGTLASGIAHNFNNITGAILGYVEMANERQLSSDIVDGIRRAGERGRELVDQVLSFARPRELAHKPVNLRVLVTETEFLLRASLRPTVELLVHETPEDLVISGTEAALQQVILNLCNNAAQAMNDGGRIELEVEAIDVATSMPLSHSVLSPGGYARISVGDSGRGIDEASLERIFEPFFTTRTTGSGLGLATALQIVREHGGSINVRSAVGVGSRFEVWLPRIVANTPEPHGSVAALPLGSGETVLIVENDARHLLKDEEVLAALGYEPVGCRYAADVQAMFREAPERFDVVILGHIAPVTAALDLAAALHEISSHRPILLAAASADDLGAKALIASGICDVVRWPIITTEIAEALQACLRHSA